MRVSSENRVAAPAGDDEPLRRGLRDLVWTLGRSNCSRRSADSGTDRADALLGLFLKAFEILDDRSGLADCRFHLGRVAYHRGDYASAEVWYERSLALMHDEDNRHGVARACYQLGLVAQAAGDLGKATQRYCRSIEASAAVKDTVGVARTSHELGNIFLLQGEYDDAETCYRVCLELFEAQGDAAGVARAHYQLAVVAEARGDEDGAGRLQQAGRSVSYMPGAGADSVRDLRDLGRLAVEAGSTTTALTCFKCAMELAKSSGLHEEAAGAASSVGTLYTELGEPERGLVYTLKSTASRLDGGQPPRGADASTLRRQRGALGPGRFRKMVTSRLRGEHAAAIMALVADGTAIAARSF